MAPEDERPDPARRAAGVELRPGARLLVFAAHPDDDVLAAGGLLRRALACGTGVAVVFATDGENNPWAQRASERRLLVNAGDRQRFGARRRAEALAGLATLGVPADRARFLGLPDQGLTRLLVADPGSAAAALRAVVSRERPTLLLGPAAADLHPDHSALAVLLRLALAGLPSGAAPAELAYVVHNPALRHVAPPRATHALTDGERAAKLAAILRHATQLHLRGPWLRSFAAATESFHPVPVPAPHPLAIRRVAGEALKIAVAARPRARAFGARRLLLLAERGDGHPRTLCCPLPALPRRVTVRDAASGAPIATGRYSGHALTGTLSLPASLVASGGRLFLKLERRFGFFDEAGWLEVGHEARGARRE